MKKIFFLLSGLLLSIWINAVQTKTVTGIVLSEDDGEPIIGASIIVKGNTTTGTITGYDGKFNLNVPNDATTLIISYVGMQTQEVLISPSMRIILQSDTKQLDEVIVVAYGTSTKKSFTGSAAVVKSDAIKQIQSPTITSALEGRAAGVQIVSSTGQPGENPTVRIRGVGSINASKDPLFIVDGATYDGPISALNVSDIESMTVLKDAAANSLYGARGANGVILITTKRNNKSRLGVTFDAKWGINSRAVPEYNMITDKAVFYEQSWRGQYNRLLAAGQNAGDIPEILAGSSANSLSSILGGYNNYNVSWADLINADGKINLNARLLYDDSWHDTLFNNALRQEYNFSIGGSDNKQSHYIGLGYLGEDSYAKGSGFERYTARVRLEKKLIDQIKIGANLSYAHTIQDYPTTSGASYINYFQWTRNIAPIYPVFLRDPQTGAIIKDQDGKDRYDYGDQKSLGYSRPYAAMSNPAGVLEYDMNERIVDNITGNAFIEADIYNGLSIRGAFDVNTTYRNESYLTNPLYGDAVSNNGYVEKYNRKWFSYTSSVFLNYNKTFGDLHIDFMAGMENYKKKYEYQYGMKRNLAVSNVPDFSNAVVTTDLTSYTQTSSTTGYLARINLNYVDKYYLSGSYRRDGSSRFHPDNRWGNFGSVGASWRINQEDFLVDNSSIDDLRMKASVGTQGNDNLLYQITSTITNTNYIPYLDQYEITNNNDHVSIKQTYVGNKDLSWEKSLNANIGFEGRFFNRFNVNFEYFYKKTTDMLFYLPVALSTGVASYPANIGSMRNSGIEMEIGITLVHSRDFSWDFGLNFSHVKNKILELPEENKETGIFSQVGGNYTKLVEGGSIYDIYLPEFAGINEDGKATWHMYENDARIGTTTTQSDAYANSRRKVGNALPDLSGGIHTNLTFKGIDLSIVLSYQLGGDAYDAVYASTMQMTEAGRGMHKDILNAWTPENTNTTVAKLQFGYTENNRASDLYLTSASYLNIRNISLGYTLPRSITKNIQLEGLRLYVAGDNLALFSKRKGFDPRQYDDGNSGFNYSPIRTISFGFNVTL